MHPFTFFLSLGIEEKIAGDDYRQVVTGLHFRNQVKRQHVC
jgi:hypothetical protein